MLPSSGYKTINRYVKLAHVPDCVLAPVLEIAMSTGARIGKKVSNSGETKVVVKATRSHSSMTENQTHLLLLMVFMVGQACLQYCNLDALHVVRDAGKMSPDVNMLFRCRIIVVDELTWGHVRQMVSLNGRVAVGWFGRFRGAAVGCF